MTADHPRAPRLPDALTPGADAPPWPPEFAGRYRERGYWRGETFGGVLRERAEVHPDRIALVDPAAPDQFGHPGGSAGDAAPSPARI